MIGSHKDETKHSAVAKIDYCLMLYHRAINGVKDMVGFRQTFNLSYSDGNETAQCEDDVEASAVLVGIHQLLLISILVETVLYISYYRE